MTWKRRSPPGGHGQGGDQMHIGGGIEQIVPRPADIRRPLLRAARLTGDPRIVSAVAELHPPHRCAYREAA